MLIAQRLGWHVCQFNNQTGVVTLVSSTTGPLELSASEAYRLLQFLYSQQELLHLFSLREEQQGGQGQ